MSLKKICEIWRDWNHKKLEAEEALLKIGEYAQPHLLTMEKQERYNKLSGKCVCGHGKSRHCLLEEDNKCSACHSEGKKCKGFKPKKKRKYTKKDPLDEIFTDD